MAVQSVQLNATVRGELGSRAMKRLRDGGRLPGVLYGHKEAVIPLTLEKKPVINHLERGVHVFDLVLDGKAEKVLVKDVQYDHLGSEVIHIDFARVSLDEKVTVTVPLELKGEPAGEKEGGVLQQILSELEVECLVTEIPTAIRVNVADMKLNDVMHVKDLALPEGVRAVPDGELIVAMVREVAEETPVEAAEAGAAEPEVIGRKAAEEGGEEEAKKES